MSKLSRTQPKLTVKRSSFQDKGAFNEINNLLYELTKMRENFADSIITLEGVLYASAQSSDPDDPNANSYKIWQSDGTGSGDDGDIMIKVTDSTGTTKSGTLVDFSADLT